MKHTYDRHAFDFLHENVKKDTISDIILDFVIDHIRGVSIIVVFILTGLTLLFFQVAWIIVIIGSIAASMLLDLTIDWNYLDE